MTTPDSDNSRPGDAALGRFPRLTADQLAAMEEAALSVHRPPFALPEDIADELADYVTTLVAEVRRLQDAVSGERKA